MKPPKIIYHIAAVIILTGFTQIGGVVYLFCVATNRFISKKNVNKIFSAVLKSAYFLVVYLAMTFFIVPIVAKPFGRVPLPLFKNRGLQPLNILTCCLNRNYTRLALKETAFEVAQQMNKKYPGTVLNYLDANFPFFNGFPLFPHLSHNDGKKLDFSFCYLDSKTGLTTNNCPSIIGYGICEEPRLSEKNTTEFCVDNGYWQYNFLRKVTPQGNKDKFIFDSSKTRDLVNILAAQNSIAKIFIEPHLKARLNLTTDKIRFHGCRAVRHDDHIHIQLQ